MIFDVVILSYAKDEHLKTVTSHALNTLHAGASETEIEFNPIVIESEKGLQPFQYPMANETLYLDEKFNYNAYMNIGFKKGSAEFVAFCNNDLEFKECWASRMIYYMNKYDLNSASPYCTLSFKQQILSEPVIKGNVVGGILAGWCIVVKRDFFEKLGGFDERVAFYCSDNIYNEQLKAIEEEHGMINRAFVNHLMMTTINKIDKNLQDELCVEETKKFNRLFDQNILGMGK